MTINKYVLYLILLLIVFGFALIPKLYKLIRYEKTRGVVTGFYDEHVSSRRGRGYMKHYPIVEFDTDKLHITFAAPSHLYAIVNIDSSVPVLYDPEEPVNAYVDNFYGLWSGPFIFLLPFFLIWTICIFSINFIPKSVRLFK